MGRPRTRQRPSRPVRDLPEYRHWTAQRHRAAADEDFATEGSTGSTFLAFIEGRPVAAGYASYTPLGLLLFGGANLRARGRSARRALVAVRAREAAARGTPVVVTHAGQMSRPIMERLGFTSVARIDRLLDVFPT